MLNQGKRHDSSACKPGDMIRLGDKPEDTGILRFRECVDLDNPHINLRIGGIAYPVSGDQQHDSPRVSLLAPDEPHASTLDLGDEALNVRELLTKHCKHLGMHAVLTGDQIEFFRGRDKVNTQEAVDLLVSADGLSKLPESIRTAGRSSQISVENAKTGAQLSGILCDSVEQVEQLLKIWAAGDVPEVQEAIKRFTRDAGDNLANNPAVLASLNSIGDDSKMFIEKRVHHIKTIVCERRHTYSAIFDYGDVPTNSPFFKTNISAYAVGDKISFKLGSVYDPEASTRHLAQFSGLSQGLIEIRKSYELKTVGAG